MGFPFRSTKREVRASRVESGKKPLPLDGIEPPGLSTVVQSASATPEPRSRFVWHVLLVLHIERKVIQAESAGIQTDPRVTWLDKLL